MKRATIFNILSKLELDYNKSWRAYRKDLGCKDAYHRWVVVQ